MSKAYKNPPTGSDTVMLVETVHVLCGNQSFRAGCAHYEGSLTQGSAVISQRLKKEGDVMGRVL